MAKYSKFILALLAFAGVLLSSGLLTGSAQAWTSAIVAGIGAALVYLVPNEQPAVPLHVEGRDPETGRFVGDPEA